MSGMSGQLEKSTGITGGTDQTEVGNIGDRLKITAPAFSAKFRTIFASPAQIITGASYVSIFSYSGSGLFVSLVIDTSQDGFQLKCLVDGTETLLQDISGTQLNGSGITAAANVGGAILVRGGVGLISFVPTYPIPYASSIQILGKRDNAGSVTVNNYLISLTKET